MCCVRSVPRALASRLSALIVVVAFLLHPHLVSTALFSLICLPSRNVLMHVSYSYKLVRSEAVYNTSHMPPPCDTSAAAAGVVPFQHVLRGALTASVTLLRCFEFDANIGCGGIGVLLLSCRTCQCRFWRRSR